MTRRHFGIATVVLAAALIACSQTPREAPGVAADEHASPSLAEAQSLAADKGALVLVDFYSPT